MYQISIRRKGGTGEEKVGAPYADHDEAVVAMEALLSERFPGRWAPHSTVADLWTVDRRRGAKLMRCGPDGKLTGSEMVTVNLRIPRGIRDGLVAIARERGLVNPKHPDSPSISAALTALVAEAQQKK